MNREQKAAVIEEIAAQLEGAEAIFAVDYRGISVPQAAELLAGLRDADTRFRIVKNRLTLRAADEAGTDGLKDFLSGPTALALVKGDAALAAKTINRLGSGDFFGEIALVSDTPRTATVTATSPVRALVITDRSFRRLMEDQPEIQGKVLAALAARLAPESL